MPYFFRSDLEVGCSANAVVFLQAAQRRRPCERSVMESSVKVVDYKEPEVTMFAKSFILLD